MYRQTEETKRDSGNNVVYTLAYGYDAVGNRTSRTLGGTTVTYVYDNNDKLTSASGGGQSASFSYDSNGNMTGVSGTMFGSKTMVYNDDNRLTSSTYGGVTDLYYYTYTGLRYRARLGGTYYRYLYNGERVLEELNDSGTMQARYTTEDGSYYGQWLHLYRTSGTLSRFPMYDNIGTARGLVDASGTVTDTYELDTFGRSVSSSGTTPNPYRFGGAWGYITDPSGFLQLGARYYWPELGRFISQDPIGEGSNWYAYVANEPLLHVDPMGTSLSFSASDFLDCLQERASSTSPIALGGYIDCTACAASLVGGIPSGGITAVLAIPSCSSCAGFVGGTIIFCITSAINDDGCSSPQGPRGPGGPPLPVPNSPAPPSTPWDVGSPRYY